jgi:hypothetical protein
MFFRYLKFGNGVGFIYLLCFEEKLKQQMNNKI